MALKSAIEWTDATWNPVTGCTKVSPGCAHCYAETITLRFKRGGPFLPGLTTIRLHPDRLALPLSWKAPRNIFVNSMSDIFHEEVPLQFIQEIFDVMGEAERHTFQVLTKRHERLEALATELVWPENVWLGVSVENQHWADLRIPALLRVPAQVRFLSVEPLLKAVDLSEFLQGVQWVIVGGESGHRARPLEAEWVRKIRDDCKSAGVSFFFKQWGGHPNRRGHDCALLDGRIWRDLPVVDGELAAAKFLVGLGT